MTRPMSLPRTTVQGRLQRPVAADAGSALEWPLAPETVRLEPGQVHLWAAALNQFLDQSPKLAALLSPAELAGAEKFRFVEDRDRFVIRRGLLRLLLSRYLQQLPPAMELHHPPAAKPDPRPAGANPPLFFNTSH